MDHHEKNEDAFKSSPLMVLISYTVLGSALIMETLLLGWETWAIPLIAFSVIICWGLHITQFMSHRVRLYTCTLLMMVSFFFYGIHITSAYDMPLVMMLIMMIYTTTGEVGLINICEVTYFCTMGYDIVTMISTDVEWDSLLISRTALHIILMFMSAWLARAIIKKWSVVFHKSDAKIDELNESTKRMNSFMANLSHELRTPINAIIGITNVMLDKEDNDELRVDMHEVIVAGRRMAEQVGDILDYSEIEMNQLVVNRGSYMIASILNDLVVELRPIIPKELELVIDVDAEVPAVLRGDSGKLHKILYHLISNGLKYTKEGGVLVHITSVKQKYGINLCIEVSDTGIGMTKDELDRLYSRFYQAESGREVRSGGLGISMVIVAGFVRSMGGFITIDSTPDKGTNVRISIPQEVEDDGRCMTVSNREVINLAGFLNIGKFSNPNVREYYNSMILNLVRGLRTSMHRVDNVDDLKKLLKKVRITHLFVADEEYLKNLDYIESLASELKVVVVARDSFELPKSAKAHILLKPFYCIPIVSILNSNHTKKDPEKRMYCNGVRALVVDDEPMNLNVAKGIFKRYGMQVFTADSGAEAVKMCKEGNYDIVFMDHMMPGMDGVETMKRIRYDAGKSHKDFPIVALTANALSTAKEMFIAEGFDGFISKPIELSELERVLKHVLSKSFITYIEENKNETETAGDSLFANPVYNPEPIVEADTAAMLVEDGEDEKIGTEISPDEVEGVSLAGLSKCGIDINMGLKYCQEGDIYMMLLEQYVEESDKKLEDIEKYYSEKDLENYTILVHALKSTSLMIGCESLSSEAKALEMAGKQKDLEYIEKNNKSVMDHYKQVISGIRKALNKDNKSDDEDIEILEFPPEGEDNEA